MMQRFVSACLVLAVVSPVAPGRSAAVAVAQAGYGGYHDDAYRPVIELRTSGEVFRRGDRVHIGFRTDTDAYVTVLRIDTDGRISVLYPYRPWENQWVRGGRSWQVWAGGSARGSHAFIVDDYPGQGYLVAVAGYEPFDFRRLTRNDQWDYRSVGYHGYLTGDPYVGVAELIDEIAPDPYAVSYDVFPYHVERRYEYPRFLCYDCHEQIAYEMWDPYRYSCVRFRIVIYDDPYYYPARVYQGTRVVYDRPSRVEPRYVFKDRTPGTSYVTTERRRDHAVPSRAPVAEDRTARRGATERARRPTPAASERVRAPERRSVLPFRRLIEPAVRDSTRGRVDLRDTVAARPMPKLKRRNPRRRPANQTNQVTRSAPASRPSVKRPSTRPATQAKKPAARRPAVKKPASKPKPSSPPPRRRRPA